MRSLLLVPLLVAVAAAEAAAQASATVDAAILSAYQWRGLTYTNRPVVQPALVLGIPTPAGAVEFGAWANFEPARYDGADDIRSGGDLAGPAVTGTALWAEYAREFGGVSAALGGTGYLYPQGTGFADQYNTAEAYLRVGWSGPLAPSLTVNYDLGTVNGAYAEASIGHTFSPLPSLPLSLRALAGFNAGQGERADARDAAYFQANGVTHLDLAVSSSWSLGALSISPVVNFSVNRDEFTRVTAPDQSRRTKVWFGATLSWQQALSAR